VLRSNGNMQASDALAGAPSPHPPRIPGRATATCPRPTPAAQSAQLLVTGTLGLASPKTRAAMETAAAAAREAGCKVGPHSRRPRTRCRELRIGRCAAMSDGAACCGRCGALCSSA
jgi:hypothetical protein